MPSWRWAYISPIRSWTFQIFPWMGHFPLGAALTAIGIADGLPFIGTVDPALGPPLSFGGPGAPGRHALTRPCIAIVKIVTNG